MNSAASLIFHFFAWQVLEYHPEPWDQWVTVGNISVARSSHAVLSIGPQQLFCLAGDAKGPASLKNTISDTEDT